MSAINMDSDLGNSHGDFDNSNNSRRVDQVPPGRVENLIPSYTLDQVMEMPADKFVNCFLPPEINGTELNQAHQAWLNECRDIAMSPVSVKITQLESESTRISGEESLARSKGDAINQDLAENEVQRKRVIDRVQLTKTERIVKEKRGGVFQALSEVCDDLRSGIQTRQERRSTGFLRTTKVEVAEPGYTSTIKQTLKSQQIRMESRDTAHLTHACLHDQLVVFAEDEGVKQLAIPVEQDAIEWLSALKTGLQKSSEKDIVSERLSDQESQLFVAYTLAEALGFGSELAEPPISLPTSKDDRLEGDGSVKDVVGKLENGPLSNFLNRLLVFNPDVTLQDARALLDLYNTGSTKLAQAIEQEAKQSPACTPTREELAADVEFESLEKTSVILRGQQEEVQATIRESQKKQGLVSAQSEELKRMRLALQQVINRQDTTEWDKLRNSYPVDKPDLVGTYGDDLAQLLQQVETTFITRALSILPDQARTSRDYTGINALYNVCHINAPDSFMGRALRERNSKEKNLEAAGILKALEDGLPSSIYDGGSIPDALKNIQDFASRIVAGSDREAVRLLFEALSAHYVGLMEDPAATLDLVATGPMERDIMTGMLNRMSAKLMQDYSGPCTLTIAQAGRRATVSTYQEEMNAGNAMRIAKRVTDGADSSQSLVLVSHRSKRSH